MVKWLAVVITGSLILVMIPMAFTAQAAGSSDAGLGVVFVHDTDWGTPLDLATAPDGNDQIIFTGTVTQNGNTGGVMPVYTRCGLSPVPTGTPEPTPTGTLTPGPTGTPCSPFDIYIHVVLSATWSGGTHTAMEIDTSYGTGASSNSGRQLGAVVIPCSIDTPSSGACSLDTYIKINSSDISWSTTVAQAYFQWVYPWWDGATGVTFDVNYLITFADEDLSPALADCEGQFLTGSTPIASGTVDARNSVGVNVLATSSLGLKIGDWIEVVTSGGPWLQDGHEPNRFDMAVKTDFRTWGELSGTTISACTTYPGMGSYVHAYMQVTSTNELSFRVNGTAFGWNSGSLGYSVYHATYSPYPANGCAELYAIQNNIGSITVSAHAANGMEFIPSTDPNIEYGYPSGLSGEIQTRYLAITTSGTFYTSTGGGSGTGSLKDVTGGGAWASMAAYPGAACTAKLDTIGHYTIYLPYTGAAIDYLARIASENFSGSGSLTFTFYIATKIQAQEPQPALPASGVCDTYYTHGTTYVSYTVAATNATGVALTLDVTKYYAIEITGGPWLNNGTASSYDMAISSDDGVSWTQIWRWPSQLCSQSADGNHSLTYIKPITGRIYKLRVYDPDDNYSDGNSGTLGVKVYVATPTGEVTQWTTCGSSYALKEINSTDTSRQVPANVEVGVSLVDNTPGEKLILTPGSDYAVDVDPAYAWEESGTRPLVDRWDYQISVDDGANWIDINSTSTGVPGLLCVAHTSAVATSPYRIYFTAQNGAYRIRVHDQNGNWADNNKYLVYRLYKVNLGSGVTPVPGEIPGTWPDNPAIWGPGCTDVCNRPKSVIVWQTVSMGGVTSCNPRNPTECTVSGAWTFNLPIPDVAGWLEYGRCALQHYISWCQEDTQALMTIPTSLQSKEPFGTFTEIMDTIKSVQNIIASYNLTGGSGSEVGPNTSSLWGPTIGGSNPTDNTNTGPLLGNLPVTSFWNGGPLDLTIGGDVTSTEEDYLTQCTVAYTKYIGSPSSTMCETFMIIKRLTGYLQKIQWMIDAAAALMIVSYIMNRWVGAGGPPK